MAKLTINQTMACLNISRQSTMKWLTEGRFPNAEKDQLSGWWLIPVEDIEKERQKLVKRYERKLSKVSTPAIEFVDNE